MGDAAGESSDNWVMCSMSFVGTRQVVVVVKCIYSIQ